MKWKKYLKVCLLPQGVRAVQPWEQRAAAAQTQRPLAPLQVQPVQPGAHLQGEPGVPHEDPRGREPLQVGRLQPAVLLPAPAQDRGGGLKLFVF